jgi:hypothetical protein
MPDSRTSGGTTVTLVVPGPPLTPQPTSTPTVVVTHPRPHLPFTGFDLSTALILTVLLLAVGALLITSGRRPAQLRRT